MEKFSVGDLVVHRGYNMDRNSEQQEFQNFGICPEIFPGTYYKITYSDHGYVHIEEIPFWTFHEDEFELLITASAENLPNNFFN